MPPGNLNDWTVNPFKPTVKGNYLIGRGANDMKASIACFVAEVSKFKKKKFKGSISLLMTGDEEFSREFTWVTSRIIDEMRRHHVEGIHEGADCEPGRYFAQCNSISLLSLKIALPISFNKVLLTPAPTSSNKTNFASTIIVLPSSKSFFCPPDRFPANSFARCLRFKNTITS